MKVTASISLSCPVPYGRISIPPVAEDGNVVVIKPLLAMVDVNFAL